MWLPTINNSIIHTTISHKIDDIYLEIIKDTETNKDSGLMGGATGELIFLFYYHLWKPNQNTEKKINSLIRSINKNIQNTKDLNYASGICGVLFAFKNLVDSELLEIEFQDEIDIFSHRLKLNNVDFLHGNTGLMHYISQINSAKAKVISNHWCEIMSSYAISENNSLKWKVKFSMKNDDYGYSFGLAHGIPAIIVVLCNIYSNFNLSNAKSLLKMALNGIFEFYNEEKTDGYFPTVVDQDNKFHYGRQLSWCYGDLACAYAIDYAGRILEDDSLCQNANKILLTCAKYTNENNEILDASICHGSIGIGHIFARMYNKTKNEQYKNAANYWYQVTLEKAIFNNGLAGYKHYHGKEIGFISERGLIEGVAGIGLSLISSISNIEPKWDKCLLLS